MRSTEEAIKMAKNFQELILNQIRKDGIQLTVFLTSGFQIRGTLKGFDSYVIIIETDGKHQMIYKHAISTIAPSKPLNLNYSNAIDD